MLYSHKKYFFGIELLDSDFHIKKGNLILFKEDSCSYNHKLFLRLFCAMNNIKTGISTDEEYLEIPHCTKLESDFENLNFTNKSSSYEFDFTEIAYQLQYTPNIDLPNNNFIIANLFSPVFNEKYNLKTENDFYYFLFSLKKHIIEQKIICAVSMPAFLYSSINFDLYFNPVFSLSLVENYTGMLSVERGEKIKRYLFQVKAKKIECEYFTEQPEDIAPTKKILSEDF